ncbi:MAG TPA: GNAT family N-acetyltransferase [Gammaproteobacteria bacterium]|nr:GNAT family N-acetyltransferase [Gammaproteobacteria bacterium]
MTTVRLYGPQDERQFRDIAVQNYIEQFQDIRSADPDDPAIQDYLTHIIQTQESGKGIILLAERESRLTGFVSLLRPDKNTADNASESAYAFMSDLFVIPECRHQGVGSLLASKLEEQARVMGATNVALRVAAENEGARHFYINKQYQEKFIVMSKGLSGHK